MNDADSLEARLYQYVYEQKRNGKTPAEIEKDLISKGLDESTAKAVTGSIEDNYDVYKIAKNKAANDNMLYGGLWCGGGLLLTIITYSMASETGGVYIVTWGPIIFGAIKFFKGVSQKS